MYERPSPHALPDDRDPYEVFHRIRRFNGAEITIARGPENSLLFALWHGRYRKAFVYWDYARIESPERADRMARTLPPVCEQMFSTPFDALEKSNGLVVELSVVGRPGLRPAVVFTSKRRGVVLGVFAFHGEELDLLADALRRLKETIR